MSAQLRIVFAGTPEFAATVLDFLLDTPHKITAVYTQPDRPAGRGRRLTSSPVKLLAQRHNIAVHQPARLTSDTVGATFEALQPDLMVVVAYGLIVPKSILEVPMYGCINVHASLLPRWRGAAPIQRAIMAGDAQTGVSIMQMNEGLDTGDVLRVVKTAIHEHDTAQTLHDRLACLGARAIGQTLEDLGTEALIRTPQDDAQATYAERIRKSEAKLDWQLSAVELERRVRAFNPWPVTYTVHQDTRIRVWTAETTRGKPLVMPGTVTECSKEGIGVATRTDCLRLLKLQWPGSRPVSAQDYLNAHPISPGQVLV